jgi:DNA replication protein DnaC
MLDFTLDSFEVLTSKVDLVADLRAWLAGDRDALLVGPVGLGKTGLAVAMLLEAMRNGSSGLYVVAPSFLSRIRATYNRAGEGVDELDVLESLATVNLLVLDDLGKVALTEWGQEKLFTVVNERYLYGRRTIYTSNLEVDDGALEEHLWPATWDRIRGRSDVFKLTGDSLRGRTT